MGWKLTAVSSLVVLVSILIYVQPPFYADGAWKIFLTHPVFAPVTEEYDLAGLSVQGQLPDHLVGGVFLRNGPNPLVVEEGKPYHWFDGDGMVFRLQFDSATSANLRSRWARTNMYKWEKRDNKVYSNGLGRFRHPWKVLAFLLRMMFYKRNPHTTTANTALMFWQKRLFCLNEGGVPFEMDPVTLDSIGPMDFQGQLKSSFTAHPKIDARSGELYFFSYFPPTKGQVTFFKATNASALQLEQKIPLHNPRIPHMFHDFAVTQTQAIWLDFSLEISPLHALKGQEFILFKPNKTAHIGWHSREDPSHVEWLPIQGGATFHNGVAWDVNEQESIVLGCRADHVPYGLFESDPPHGNAGAKTRADQMPFLYEWRLNRAQKSVSERFLLDKASGKRVPCEFPNVDLKNSGRRNRFVFGVSPDEKGNDLSQVPAFVKYDLDLELAHYFRFGADETIGEPFFVRDAFKQEEDGGSVICFVFNQKTQKSRLAVIDAHSMKEVASVQFDIRIPQGFHTLFVTKQDLSQR